MLNQLSTIGRILDEPYIKEMEQGKVYTFQLETIVGKDRCLYWVNVWNTDTFERVLSKNLQVGEVVFVCGTLKIKALKGRVNCSINANEVSRLGKYDELVKEEYAKADKELETNENDYNF